VAARRPDRPCSGFTFADRGSEAGVGRVAGQCAASGFGDTESHNSTTLPGYPPLVGRIRRQAMDVIRLPSGYRDLLQPRPRRGEPRYASAERIIDGQANEGRPHLDPAFCSS
jgi:hypothetical protein